MNQQPPRTESRTNQRATTNWSRVGPRICAIAVAGSCVVLWPQRDAAYGPAFWLWACGIGGYALSFQRGQTKWRPSPRLVWTGLFAVLALAAAFRFVALGETPVSIHIDEILPALESLHILRGEKPNVFSSVGWFNTPNLTFAFGALAIKATGRDGLFAVRLSSAILGMGGILCVFLLARRWFGDRVALVASFLMAVSYWHTYESRTAFTFVQTPFWVALVLYLLVRGLQDRSRLTLAVAGICAGLGLECYFPVRILVLLCPVCCVIEWVRNRVPLRAALADAVTFGTAVVLVLLPLFVCVPWPVVAQRSQRVLLTDPISLSGFQAAYHVTGIWPVFLHNVQSALSMFTESADLAVHVHSPGGLLDGATLIAVIGGSFVAIAQGEPDALLLVGWIAFTLLAGVAFTDNPRASYRLAAAMPAIFMVAAVGVERALLQLGPRRRLYRFTVCPLLIGIIALWIATDNYRLFIAVAAPEHYLSAALRLVGSHCDGRRFYFVGDWLAQNAPLSQEPTDWVEVFCSDHRALQLEQIPKGLDADRPATFLLVPWADPRFSEILRSCYPTAEATPHFGRDGHLLFTSVDVSAGNLRIDGGCAETLVGSESACVIPAVDAAKMGGPEKDAM